MKVPPKNTQTAAPAAAILWADVAAASKEKVEPTEQVSVESTSTTPAPGDQVVHQKFGLCTVHRIEGDFIHMAPVNGRVIRLSKAIVSFQLTEITNGRRVFSTSIQPQQ